MCMTVAFEKHRQRAMSYGLPIPWCLMSAPHGVSPGPQWMKRFTSQMVTPSAGCGLWALLASAARRISE